jgi:hypothetical protein
MLVRFSSTKTESITMFGDVAIELIRIMGSSGTVPGAIRAEDIPAAVQRLRKLLQTSMQPRPDRSETTGAESDGRDREPPVSLATRAAPLISLLERAAAADVPLMWESD